MRLKSIHVSTVRRSNNKASWRVGSVSCIFDHVRRAADFEVNVEHGAVEPARGEAPLHMLTDKERNFVQGKALAAYAVAFPNEIKSMSGD